MPPTARLPTLLLPLLLLLAACGPRGGEPADPPAGEPAPGDGAGTAVESPAAAVTSPEAYYQTDPDFFRFASPEDLPADLDWRDGADQPVFASPDAVRGGTLDSFIRSKPPTIRRVGPDSNNSFRGVLYDENSLALIDRHPDTLGFIPSLATSWAVGDDRKTLYFRLDPDARFSDGEPVTADDYFYLFYFMQSPHNRAPWYNDFYTREYAGITRFDDHTIAVHLAEEKPEPLEFAIGPLPAHFYGTLGPDFPQEFQWKFEPTTGPYELRPENLKIDRGEITLTRVPDWWADDKKFFRHRYNPERKHYTVVQDVNLAFERFLKGEFDLFSLQLPEFWYDKTRGEPVFERGLVRRYVFHNLRPRPNFGLWINTADPLLADPDIRVGIHHATDFQTVIDKFFRGDYQRLRTTSDGYSRFTHPTLEPRPFDDTRAREAFARAGYEFQGPDGILRNADGDRLSVTVSFNDGPAAAILAILQQEARKAGLEMNLLPLEGTSFYKQVMEKRHQIAFFAWGVSLPYPRYWEHFHSVNANKPQTNNITNTANPGMDPVIDQYRSASTLEEKIELAHRLEEMVHDQAVFVPGYKATFYRVAAWRWVKFPEFFDVRISEGPNHYGLLWIDEEEKKRILSERRGDTSYPAEIVVHDQWATE